MKKRTAVAYFRTSSAANVGTDKDSERRQREAVEAYGRGSRLTVVKEFYDALSDDLFYNVSRPPLDVRSGSLSAGAWPRRR